MIVKFKHGEFNYRYNSTELHWIFKEVSKNCYETFCPVLFDVQKHIEEVPREVKISILKSIVHSYRYAYDKGKTDKIKEVWHALSIDKLQDEIRFSKEEQYED